MHEAYLIQNFDEAIYRCERLKKHFEGKMKDYYSMWIQRCEYMKTQDSNSKIGMEFYSNNKVN